MSSNQKTGFMPVSTHGKQTCPPACPLQGKGCYAESGPVNIHWEKITRGERGKEFFGFLKDIAALPEGQIWRMAQAGDLPGEKNQIDSSKLAALVEVNRNKMGFGYTHKPVIGKSKFVKSNRAALAAANKNGLIINLSANNLKHADKLAALKIAPVVVVLPPDTPKTLYTPKGNKVITCPATYKDNVTCESCRLCAKGRSVIVGFPVHGTGKHKAAAVCESY
jgi:hypothetical protein